MIFPLIGIAFSFLLLKYRQQIGDSIGEGEWMKKFGGIYMIVVFTAIFIFFWSLAALTGTTGILFKPLTWLFPGMHQGGPQMDPGF